MKAICDGQLYHKRMIRAHDKKIQPRQFQEGELVFKRIPQNKQDPYGKWSPNWERPYVVKKAFSEGALILIEMDRKELCLRPPKEGLVKIENPKGRFRLE